MISFDNQKSNFSLEYPVNSEYLSNKKLSHKLLRSKALTANKADLYLITTC